MIARKLKYKIVNLAVIAVFISVVAVTGCQNTQKGNEQENGKVKETEQRDQEITDVTTLTQLTNKEGDEEVTSLGSNRYEWENHGEDIHYEGTADPGTLLPVSVKLTYYLDGQEVSADQLAGATGRIRIRMDSRQTKARPVSSSVAPAMSINEARTLSCKPAHSAFW